MNANAVRASLARPIAWIPTLYFAQGLPYVLVMTVSVVMYKRLGVSNTAIAFVTSWLYLPWVLKPLWSPLIDLRRTRRWWTLVMQAAGAASLGAIALSLHTPAYVGLSLAVFSAMALASATHDIACDGFYMLALPERAQAAYVGLRSTFYRLAMIAGQGGLVVLAGRWETATGDIRTAWSMAMTLAAAVFAMLMLYHVRALPRPSADIDRSAQRARRADGGSALCDWKHVFATFFARPQIGRVLAFLLLYRFAEAQLVKMVTPFLLDGRDSGGLGLSTTEVGIAYGTVGVIALLLGGILGGLAGARWGLQRILWPCVVALHLPDAIFLALALVQPQQLMVVSAALAVEQFGYGFGFAAYLLFMLMIASGPYQTAHYAMATGIMALGMMVPGMASGALQEALGYPGFFLWVMLSTIPGFIVPALVRIEPDFGRRQHMPEDGDDGPRP
ncbi:MAG: Protein AmpG [Gemmatimonadaceae bacterium]|nr:Protein AmpG [Gemmatimonadaceae bacterium]